MQQVVVKETAFENFPLEIWPPCSYEINRSIQHFSPDQKEGCAAKSHERELNPHRVRVEIHDMGQIQLGEIKKPG